MCIMRKARLQLRSKSIMMNNNIHIINISCCIIYCNQPFSLIVEFISKNTYLCYDTLIMKDVFFHPWAENVEQSTIRTLTHQLPIFRQQLKYHLFQLALTNSFYSLLYCTIVLIYSIHKCCTTNLHHHHFAFCCNIIIEVTGRRRSSSIPRSVL